MSDSCSSLTSQKTEETVTVNNLQCVDLSIFKDKKNQCIQDVIEGYVIEQNFHQNSDSLEYVRLMTVAEISGATGQVVVLTNCHTPFQGSYGAKHNVLRINNLNIFGEQFSTAARFKQVVGLIYNHRNRKIEALSLHHSLGQKKPDQSSRPHPPRSSLAESSQHSIEVRFEGHFSATQKQAFWVAAGLWSQMIKGNLSSVVIGNEAISGLVVKAVKRNIDGRSGILGQSIPTHLRAKSLLPAQGMMLFDTSDIEQLEVEGSLFNLIFHEMGHVLGIGTLWEQMGLLRGVGTNNPTFIGPNAMAVFAKMMHRDQPTPVPVENIGDQGTRNVHWRESIFKNEVMTSIMGNEKMILSMITMAALRDMGYSVSPNSVKLFEDFVSASDHR
ncbi:MAG: leishmanolysin-related zinc metalloendopeptidase [Thermosynechococcaceae cyanobacterium]